MSDPASNFNPDLADAIREYIGSKPPTKRSITAVEITSSVGGTSRTAPDTLSYMSEMSQYCVGEQIKSGENSRWSLER